MKRPELRERGIATEWSRFQQPGFAREPLKINVIFHDCVSPQQINDDIAALMLAEPPSLFAQINVNPFDQLALWLVPSSYSSFDYSFAVHQLNCRSLTFSSQAYRPRARASQSLCQLHRKRGSLHRVNGCS
jgi:hypothetical protein